MKKMIISFAMTLTAGATAFAVPSTTHMDAAQSRRLLDAHQPQVNWALTEAGIPSSTTPMGGAATRFGQPGKYFDVYVIRMASCGPTLTSPCKFEGCVKITEIFETGKKPQAIINASKQCN